MQAGRRFTPDSEPRWRSSVGRTGGRHNSLIRPQRLDNGIHAGCEQCPTPSTRRLHGAFTNSLFEIPRNAFAESRWDVRYRLPDVMDQDWYGNHLCLRPLDVRTNRALRSATVSVFFTSLYRLKIYRMRDELTMTE